MLSEKPSVCLIVTNKKGQRVIGASVCSYSQQSIEETMDLKTFMKIELFEFLDNEQFSNFDTFLTQIGEVNIYISEECDDKAKGDFRKIFNILSVKNLDLTLLKKKCFLKNADTMDNIIKIIGGRNHMTNSVETEMPNALGCTQCLIQVLNLLETDLNATTYELCYGSLNTYMRLDSAAAEAVNLFPKADHPSTFGSLYGILNRCRTKLGSRLLDRWIRQPLLNEVEINERLDIVQTFYESSSHRNELRDGPLKAVPDLDAVITKMHKNTAGLDEAFRLYLFVRSIPSFTAVLHNLVESLSDSDDDTLSENKTIAATSLASANEADGVNETIYEAKSYKRAQLLTSRYLTPLNSIADKFTLYEQLIEHVVDLSQLPELKVNPQHDAELLQLDTEQQQLIQRAERILAEARDDWASFTDAKLESNHTMYGITLRTTRGDDERQLRANYPSVRILSIQKTGLYFTTPALERISDRYRTLQDEYKEKQSELVAHALETARTYLPVVEAVAAVLAEVDVLLSFATAAALSPGVYTRPIIHKRGTGRIEVKGARHPCVELMDNMQQTQQQFISNDYDLVRGKASLQIITGPNMGGKSTYIRAVGCIVVLAQIGMFVPCDSADISVIDCILARVGAGDAVQKGVSTFMAEMLESSVMLQTATRDSLIIIDELGRGTSTYDGFGLAWSISDYIVRQLQCLCLFATHFHELTSLARVHPTEVVNKHVAAHIDSNKGVIMLYKLNAGPCTQSFGIHVATTADFPDVVIADAKRKARCLEAASSSYSSSDGKYSESDSERCEESSYKRKREALERFAELNFEKVLSDEDIVKSVKEIFCP